MDKISKKRILLLITNAYAATNFIHSGLIKPLAQEYEVYILSDLINSSELEKINSHFGIITFKLTTPVPLESWYIRQLRRLEKVIFFAFFQVDTQKIKNQQNSCLYIFFINSILKLIHSLGLSKTLLQFLRRQIISVTQKNSTLDDLTHYQFSGVISSSPLDVRENTIVNFLKQKSISSLAVIISWDNLTSKGIINADHDHVFVWNEFMAAEYLRFYAVFKTVQSKIHITGIPRFDIYFQPNSIDSLCFREKYQILSSNKIILFATSAFIHSPNQADIVQHLTEYVSEKENLTLIIRCHAGDDCEKYKKFESLTFIRIWHPERSNIPDLNVLQDLAEMLKNCDLCIQVASTIRLEAAACNKPVISIAYDGNVDLPFKRSVKRLYAYSHQLPLNELAIDHMVFNKKELFDSLDDSLSHSSLKFALNKGKLRRFIHHTSPDATSSTIKSIRKWLG
ncbi:CDP-glycerol glycerophosphotransferase family protein [Dyadobacter psychrotolerans]|uniref:UDP-glycosyltransferase n=1 Tax=Dyadobacter psychrotolerans TaxID=2541721 RepID=A0A4R5DI41_9BACT|nr:CDP-glycerol glycerophosphotransferase family protein [Dyadobacter psychrotolerans]TDE11601.1 hypothetical protein E0F88_24540 [Dyadobacter psychrotolerans]